MTSVEPRATTGRITVKAGDVVASTWGNTTFDQTVECFDSTSGRDTQWPTPHDGATCYTVDTGTLWLRQAGVWVLAAAAPIRARAYLSTAQGCVGSAFQIITFNAFDFGATYFAGGVFTVPTGGGGDYLITAGVMYDAATTRAGINIYVNGAQRTVGPGALAAGNAFDTRAVTDILALNAADQIDIRSYVVAPGNVNMSATSPNTHVAIRRLPVTQ
jgi:hypothetical protein